MNVIQNAIDLRDHLIIPIPQHVKPSSMQRRSSCLIVCDLIRMLTAIEFDHERGIKRYEVDDVGAYSMLPTKFGSRDLPSS